MQGAATDSWDRLQGCKNESSNFSVMNMAPWMSKQLRYRNIYGKQSFTQCAVLGGINCYTEI